LNKIVLWIANGKVLENPSTWIQSDDRASLEHLRCIFNEFDADQSGNLEKQELAKVVEKLYQEAGVEESISDVLADLDKLMTRYDTDDYGSLDFSEFVDMIADGHFKFKMSSSLREGLRELLDADFNGEQTKATKDNPFLGIWDTNASNGDLLPEIPSLGKVALTGLDPDEWRLTLCCNIHPNPNPALTPTLTLTLFKIEVQTATAW